MVPSKMNAKYHIWIWVGLVFASFVRNIYPIYLGFSNLEVGSTSAVAINILYVLFVDGIIPAFLCYLCASIVYSFGFRRYVRAISRNDFIYLTMAFTAAARMIMGIIESFSILEPRVFSVTSAVLDISVLSLAFFLMFFLVIKPMCKLNPKEKYDAFSCWSMWYLIGLGILQVVPNFTVLMLSDGSQTSSQLLELLKEYYGVTLATDPVQLAGSISAICIYFAIVIVVIVLSQVMRKKAVEYQDPQSREKYFNKNTTPNYFGDYNKVFGDQDDSISPGSTDGDANDKKNDDNVFDEFDI